MLMRTGSGSFDLDPKISCIRRTGSFGSLFISPPRSVVHFDRKPPFPPSSTSPLSSPDYVPSLRRSGSDACSSLRSIKWPDSAGFTDDSQINSSSKNNNDNKNERGSGSVVLHEEVEFTGGGGCGGDEKGKKIGGGGGSGGGGGGGEIGEYYKEMLKVDPENPLLLRNYGKFLQEIEGDVEGAEECYGRAILVSPGDGEVLSLYGKLMWEVHSDDERAEVYYKRAVEASPDDSYVLGSYAHFLWNAEEESSEPVNGVMLKVF